MIIIKRGDGQISSWKVIFFLIKLKSYSLPQNHIINWCNVTKSLLRGQREWFEVQHKGDIMHIWGTIGHFFIGLS